MLLLALGCWGLSACASGAGGGPLGLPDGGFSLDNRFGATGNGDEDDVDVPSHDSGSYGLNEQGEFTLSATSNNPFGQPDAQLDLDFQAKRKLHIKSIYAVCKYSSTQLVKLRMIGALKVKAGVTRTIRIVDQKTNTYLDTQNHSDQGDNIDFVIRTGMQMPIQFYLLPKSFVPTILDDQRPCSGDACKTDTVPIVLMPLYVLTPTNVDLANVNAPECNVPMQNPEVEAGSGN